MTARDSLLGSEAGWLSQAVPKFPGVLGHKTRLCRAFPNAACPHQAWAQLGDTSAAGKGLVCARQALGAPSLGCLCTGLQLGTASLTHGQPLRLAQGSTDPWGLAHLGPKTAEISPPVPPPGGFWLIAADARQGLGVSAPLFPPFEPAQEP